jgi:hypothetical protein
MGNCDVTPTYRANDKEILRDGKHFADVCSPDAARALVTLLMADEVVHAPGTPDADLAHMEGVLWDD